MHLSLTLALFDPVVQHPVLPSRLKVRIISRSLLSSPERLADRRGAVRKSP